ncbi:MAG: glycine zipper 2TM domain-containing protein, partial [Rhodospirillales bacterium]
MSSIVNIKGILSVLLVLAVTVGCQTLQDSPKQTVGTLIGAGLGALTGSQIGGGKGQLAAVAIGALGGAYLGSELGASLDRADKLYAQRNAQDSLEYSKTGNALAWKNPDSGHSGTFTPT